MNKPELLNTLKTQLIQALNLEGMKPEDIATGAPLFGEGLGLDSIDALELIVLMEKHYGLKIDTAEEGKKIFYSIGSMADFIIENGNPP
jgi:acyl carrier protein